MSHEHDTSGDDDHHEHEAGPLAELVTLRDWLRFAVTRFNRAGIFCGHGLIDSYDEAAYLLLHTLSLPIDRLEPFLDACITTEEREALLSIVERRADERTPAAYLTGEAWLGDFRFRVDPRVIIPRSYFAELLENGFAPWIDDPDSVGSVLDMYWDRDVLPSSWPMSFPRPGSPQSTSPSMRSKSPPRTWRIIG